MIKVFTLILAFYSGGAGGGGISVGRVGDYPDWKTCHEQEMKVDAQVHSKTGFAVSYSNCVETYLWVKNN